MTIGNSRESRPPVALVAIDADLPTRRFMAVIQSSLETGCQVMVMDAAGRQLPAALAANPAIHRHPPMPRAGRGDAIRSMAAAAAQAGITHLITLEQTICCEQTIAVIAQQLQAHPKAVICAARALNSTEEKALVVFRRTLANFCFRVQTGVRVTDATGGFRAYPLPVLQRLDPFCRGPAFDYEMLVRTVWAEVAVREVEAGAIGCRQAAAAPLTKRVGETLVFIGLQIHLTMRSVVPWPHRKVDSRDSRDASISLMHPRRSLNILLGQNISAARLGLSAALGVFLGTLPLIACHSIATLFMAGFFRLSKVAALSAGQLCMPPIVPALCIELGYYLRHGTFLTEISLRTIGYEALDRLVEWLIGSLILAPLLATAAGALVYVMARHIAQRAVGDRAPGGLKEK